MFNVRSARSMFNIARFASSIMLEMDSKPSISVSCSHRHAGRPQRTLCHHPGNKTYNVNGKMKQVNKFGLSQR